jgi:hypothetical protein
MYVKCIMGSDMLPTAIFKLNVINEYPANISRLYNSSRYS